MPTAMGCRLLSELLVYSKLNPKVYVGAVHCLAPEIAHLDDCQACGP